jgi:hypothetical protein
MFPQKSMNQKKIKTDKKAEKKADNYDKEKDAVNQKKERSKKGDTKSGNKILLEQSDSD